MAADSNLEEIRKDEPQKISPSPAQPPSAPPLSGFGTTAPSDAAPGDGNDQVKAEPPSDGRKSKKKAHGIKADSVDADTVHIADRINIQKTDIHNNYIPHSTATAIRQFSINDCWPIAEDRESEIACVFVADPADIDAMWRILSKKRLLVIGGDREIGKGATAIYLGKLLADSEEPMVEETTYLIQPLDRHIRINLREICADSEIFGKRLVIFEDVLMGANPDLERFFSRLEHGGADVTERLQRNNSFLILTAQTADLASFQRALAENGFYYKLGRPGQDLLDRGLDLRLEFIAERLQSAKEQMQIPDERLQLAKTQIEILRKRRQLMFDEFKTMPLTARFIEYFFGEIRDEGIALALEEAIRRFKNISYWFLKDLSKDFDAWCFAVSLCLAQIARDMQGVPWMEFERLWRALATCLKSDPELFPQSSDNQAKGEGSADNSPELSENSYLEKCRAMIVKDPASLSDMIRFRDPSYPAELWKTLMGSHRRILAIILLQLRKTVETEIEAYDWNWRALTAQIIGRIGELDPSRITFTMMERWVNANDRRLRASVGYLYRGLLASTDKRYRDLCLEELRTFIGSGGDGEAEKDRLMTAIAAYRQVGVFDLPLAMSELQRLARIRLEPILRDTQRIERMLDRVERKFHQPLYLDQAIGLLITKELLRDFAYRLYANEGGTFFGIQLALASLCHEVDPVRVFHQLRDWIASSNTMGTLVALMFLQESGIASQLEVHRVEVPAPESPTEGDSLATASADADAAPDGVSDSVNAGSDNTKERADGTHWAPLTVLRSNPIVLSLTAGTEAVEQTARFLAAIYESITTTFTLPGRSQRYFRISFLQHLKTWVIDAVHIESCRLAIEDLMVELLQIRDGSLKEPIYQLLTEKNFASQESELKIFADAVLRRS
jgi:hypothetical protein